MKNQLSELTRMGRNLSQLGMYEILSPKWPHASHFKEWEWAPLTLASGDRTKVVDLYWTVNGGRSKGELLIGIQMSSEDGDYMSPFIETGNSLHSCYKDHPWVVEAYRIACEALGILPQWYDRRLGETKPMDTAKENNND